MSTSSAERQARLLLAQQNPKISQKRRITPKRAKCGHLVYIAGESGDCLDCELAKLKEKR